MARRIQMSRQRPWRAENPEAVIVARPSKWGNDFAVGAIITDPTGQLKTTVRDRAHAVALFRKHQAPALRSAALAELAGRDVACWCPEDEPCHGDVLLELANGGGDV